MAIAVFGVDAQIITIEVNVVDGTKFFMSGLPDNTVKVNTRIESVFKYLEYRMPRRKVLVNLAPAGLRKEGSAYDLPMALGILKSSGQIKTLKMEDYIIMGELALDGTLRPIKGALPIAIEARKQGFKGFLLPYENANPSRHRK